MPLTTTSTPPPDEPPLSDVVRGLADQIGGLIVHLEATRSGLLTAADRLATTATTTEGA